MDWIVQCYLCVTKRKCSVDTADKHVEWMRDRSCLDLDHILLGFLLLRVQHFDCVFAFIIGVGVGVVVGILNVCDIVVRDNLGVLQVLVILLVFLFLEYGVDWGEARGFACTALG